MNLYDDAHVARIRAAYHVCFAYFDRHPTVGAMRLGAAVKELLWFVTGRIA